MSRHPRQETQEYAFRAAEQFGSAAIDTIKTAMKQIMDTERRRSADDICNQPLFTMGAGGEKLLTEHGMLQSFIEVQNEVITAGMKSLSETVARRTRLEGRDLDHVMKQIEKQIHTAAERKMVQEDEWRAEWHEARRKEHLEDTLQLMREASGGTLSEELSSLVETCHTKWKDDLSNIEIVYRINAKQDRDHPNVKFVRTTQLAPNVVSLKSETFLGRAERRRDETEADVKETIDRLVATTLPHAALGEASLRLLFRHMANILRNRAYRQAGIESPEQLQVG